jgi:hypothetical protein
MGMDYAHTELVSDMLSALCKSLTGRGAAEQWIKESKNAEKWARLSCYDFAENQVRLRLFALAYNLGNSMRDWHPPRA